MIHMIRKSILKTLIVSWFLTSPIVVIADPLVPSAQIPPSIDWINNLINIGSTIGDITSPLNWVIYSTAGTYFYYQYIFKAALKTAVSARSMMILQLRETKLTLKEKEKLTAEMDDLVSALKVKVAESEKALNEIPNHFTFLNKHRYQGNHNPFLSTADYSSVEKWLKEKEGKKFLSTKKGQAWKEKYDSLIMLTSVALDEPLKKVIDKANEVFDNPKANIIRASNDPMKSPGTFSVHNDFTYQQTNLSLKAVTSNIENLRKNCADILKELVSKEKNLGVNSKYVRFWTNKENIKPFLTHGIITLAGAGGTFWLHRLYQKDRTPLEPENQEKLKRTADLDFSTKLKTETERAMGR